MAHRDNLLLWEAQGSRQARAAVGRARDRRAPRASAAVASYALRAIERTLIGGGAAAFGEADFSTQLCEDTQWHEEEQHVSGAALLAGKSALVKWRDNPHTHPLAVEAHRHAWKDWSTDPRSLLEPAELVGAAGAACVRMWLTLRGENPDADPLVHAHAAIAAIAARREPEPRAERVG